MPHYRFFVCDVFTLERFGGNQLAVLPEAEGLSDTQMQQIAREFNYSESTFVLPPTDDSTRVVRIFTPTTEVPFAGHPNIGTAFALATDGAFGDIGDGIGVVFDEKAGKVAITVKQTNGRIWCELIAPQPVTIGPAVTQQQIAEVLSISAEDVVIDTHPPQVASVGLPFLVVELASRDALERARIDMPALEELHDAGIVPDIHLYVRSNDEFDIRARMYAPFDGVPEDPATGSANCALVAMLTQVDNNYSSGGSWRIAQGVEMGRPSVLEARTRRDGDDATTWIGGFSVLVADGVITVE